MKGFANVGTAHARILTVGIVGAAALGLTLFSTSTTVDAHKAKTSPYSYYADIFPLLRDNCGRCHTAGGPAPMSLMTYDTDGGAVAWAESIREMLLAGAMPPYYADPTGPAVRNPHSLTPRELDKIITWATQGTPHGDQSIKLSEVKPRTTWAGGKPDAELQLPQPYTMGPGTMQASADFIVPTTFPDEKWVKAADLMPGIVSMVRRAYISIDGGPVLAVWEPGDDAVDPPSGAAFKLAPGAKDDKKSDGKKAAKGDDKKVDPKKAAAAPGKDPEKEDEAEEAEPDFSDEPSAEALAEAQAEAEKALKEMERQGGGDSTLSRYFREMASHRVLTPQEEIEAAKEVERLEIGYWEALFGLPLDPDRVELLGRRAAVLEALEGLGAAHHEVADLDAGLGRGHLAAAPSVGQLDAIVRCHQGHIGGG